MTVVVVGDVVTDIVAVHNGQLATGSDTDASITITGGGAAANTAAWLARLGVPVTLVAVVGADPAGAARIEELRAAGVRCAVRRAAGAATGSIVVLSSGDERTMLVDRGANGLLTAADVVPAVPGARHIHVSGYTLFDPRTRPAGVEALRSGATTSVDAASAAPLRSVGGRAFMQWIRPTGLLFANLDEAGALLESLPGAVEPPAGGLGGAVGGAAERLAERLAGAVGGTAVVKLGAAGAVWSDVAGTAAAHGVPATVVDPTGAGDAFAAGYLAAWLDGADPETCLARGVALGAEAVARAGARPAP
jgi:sugar/nucleoside kinase (ribokinase family)